MKKLMRAAALVLALSIYGQAGDMPNGVISPPPPPVGEGEAPNGDMPNGVAAEDDSCALALLEALLAIF